MARSREWKPQSLNAVSQSVSPSVSQSISQSVSQSVANQSVQPVCQCSHQFVLELDRPPSDRDVIAHLKYGYIQYILYRNTRILQS